MSRDPSPRPARPARPAAGAGRQAPPQGRRYPGPVSIRLYDTASREVRELTPVHPGHVGIYHCGLTVQAAPHVGHIRKEVAFDVLRRWLEHSGLASRWSPTSPTSTTRC